MQIVFYTSIIYSILLIQGYTAKKFRKPSFNPYCTTRDRCKPDCTCEVYPNCMMLDMDETLRNGILFYYNQHRDVESLSEPQAAGMTMLQYDMELEEISTCWASRCENEYSECFITPRFSETSQTAAQLYLEKGQQPNLLMWVEVLKYWLNHSRPIYAEFIQSLPAGEEGENLHNYVQVMTDRILAVGCAWSLIKNLITFVCTYGPRGPLQGEPIYKTGYICSLCPGGYSCDYKKPFEQLCKLRIYSVVSPVPTEAITSYESPPPPPPLPYLPEDPTDEYNEIQDETPTMPDPPNLVDYPYIQQKPFCPPIPPSPLELLPPPDPLPPKLPKLPEEGDKCPTEATEKVSERPRKKSDETDTANVQQFEITIFSLCCLIVKLLF